MLTAGPETFQIDERDDAELAKAARAQGLSMSVFDLRELRERLGRNPSTVEVYAFDAQWSEHCSYKSSRPLLKRLPTKGPDVILGPAEDAGVLRLGEWNGSTYGVVVAHESHNHPSQIVPFEGAATGIGGIVRDVLCMGATLIGVADPLRFGRIDLDTDKSRHAEHVAQRAVAGIGAYGNAIGVPNMGGDVYFHEGFDENCLVNVVALGLVKDVDLIHSWAPENSDGWDIILVGKATDRSGFGGAAFSSLVLDADDVDSKRGAVQVPDPFLKNVIMRASYRVFEMLRAEKIIAGFKDLGAGGIMGCSAEIVSAGGMGAEIDLDLVPLAQPDLPPAVIAVGETQERLTWVVPREVTPRVLAIYNEEFSLPLVAHGAGATVIGKVTKKQHYILKHGGREVVNVPLDVLTGDVRRTRVEAPAKTAAAQPDAPLNIDLEYLRDVLSHRDVCSRRPIIERYDSVVRGTTAIPPGYADAGVVLPIPGAPIGVALSVDSNPRYGALDAKRAAEFSVIESVRNVTAVGARPLGLTDCLNFGNPERPDHYGELVAAVDGLALSATELGLAYVSGNVSLYNEASNGKPVPASAVVGCIGVVDNIANSVMSTFVKAGSQVFLVGQRQNALAGTVIQEVAQLEAAALPEIDYAALRTELTFVRENIVNGTILSGHDISDGGLLGAVAEMCFAFAEPGEIGAHILSGHWSASVGRAAAYFGEAGGFIVEVKAEAADAFVARAKTVGAHAELIGTTIPTAELQVDYEIKWSVPDLFDAWDHPLTEVYP
jgi:phosphoribosylformylglycinamidine synthase II